MKCRLVFKIKENISHPKEENEVTNFSSLGVWGFLPTNGIESHYRK